MADAVVIGGEAAAANERLVEVGEVLGTDDLLCRLVLLYQPDDVLVGGRRRIAEAAERTRVARGRGGCGAWGGG